MLISSNPMISVLHNIMWSIGKNVTHKAKGKNSTSTMETELKVTESALGVHVLGESSARWSELHLDLKCTGFCTPCALRSSSTQERTCLI